MGQKINYAESARKLLGIIKDISTRADGCRLGCSIQCCYCSVGHIGEFGHFSKFIPFQMKLYKFAPITARSFPTIADIKNPYIFPQDLAIVINVSMRYDAYIANELENRGILYYHLPLDEETNDIGWDNIIKAVNILLRLDKENKRMIVHCDFGQHRSRLVIEAFYFAKMGAHFVDNYKNYDNHLLYNCFTKHLPPLDKVEAELARLNLV